MKPTTIRFNKEEHQTLEEMGNFLGLSSRSAIIKACMPWAKQRLDTFLKDFKHVIQPLKYSEIDALISTLKIIAKQVKKEKKIDFGL